MGINRLSHGRIEAGAGLPLGWLPYQPLGRLLGLFLGLLLGLFLGLAAPVAAQQLERVSQSLQNPWGMSFIDAGAVLVTERGGGLSVVDLSDGRVRAVAGTPKAVAGGQGGMLDVLYDQGEVFLCFTGRASLGRTATTLGKGRWNPDGPALEGYQQLFQASNPGFGLHHFGCRLGLDPKGRLYMTIGDRLDQDSAQSDQTHLGSTIRLNRDGSLPADNPFLGREGARPELFSIGHRNPQGLAIHPQSGKVWINEHGPQGGDEINLLEPGANFGWPLYTFGERYGGGKIGRGTGAPGFVDPLWHWTPSIAPSDMTFVPPGSQFPAYEGDLLVTSLKFKRLYHVSVEGEGVTGQSIVIDGNLGRLRDVEVGPDGAIYLLNDEDPGGLYRLSR